jgi:hypothetical protein
MTRRARPLPVDLRVAEQDEKVALTEAEVVSAGFNCQALLGVEGPGWILSNFDERWADTRKREDLFRIARALEREVSMIGVSAHLLAVGNKE